VIRRGYLLVAAVIAAVVAPGTAASATATAPGSSGHAPSTPIQHLVVMTQDQHSFDNYFGTRPGVDGIPAKACVPAADKSKPCVAPFAIDKNQSQARLRMSAAAERIAVDGGRMDGFARAQRGLQSASAAAMGYYRPEDVPALTALADRAVLFDRWFASVPGGTIPNRLFGIAAQTKGDAGSVPAAGWASMPVIFDRLQAAGISWRIYVQNYEPALTIKTASAKSRAGGQIARVPLLAMPRFTRNPALSGHIVDMRQYFSDLAQGRLPAVSYVVSTSSTERFPTKTGSGENPITTVANALISSSAWPRSAFVLDYDSAGGWYDHVAPPVVKGARLGMRVPAMVISPYATPHTTNHTTLDASAVLKFIEGNWHLAPLTSRDRDAGNLAAALDFRQPPSQPVLVDVAPHGSSVAQPSSITLYLGYGVAAAVAALAIGWAFQGRGRRLGLEGTNP
jgi:phospholipase C